MGGEVGGLMEDEGTEVLGVLLTGRVTDSFLLFPACSSNF